MFFKKKKKIEYIKTSEVAEHFQITAQKLNEIFELLKWARKEDKSWIATELGKSMGTEEINFRGTKSIHWNSEIKNNPVLIFAIEEFQKTKVNSTPEIVKVNERITDKEKKEKGDKYEAFIANHFRAHGYTIAEHGKDNGVKDHGIDIIAKKGKEVLFIQCKNWSATSSRKVKSDDMKIAKQNVQDYQAKNPLYKMYSMKILYVMSENVLHGSAYHYLQEKSEEIEFRIIPIID
jgi:restriction system protein